MHRSFYNNFNGSLLDSPTDINFYHVCSINLRCTLNERTDAAVSEKRSERHKRERGSKKRRRKIRPKRRPRLIVKQNASTELNESHFQVFPRTHIELQSIMLLSILLNPLLRQSTVERLKVDLRRQNEVIIFWQYGNIITIGVCVDSWLVWSGTTTSPGYNSSDLPVVAIQCYQRTPRVTLEINHCDLCGEVSLTCMNMHFSYLAGIDAPSHESCANHLLSDTPTICRSTVASVPWDDVNLCLHIVKSVTFLEIRFHAWAYLLQSLGRASTLTHSSPARDYGLK